jgi:hypothetical protein
LLYGRQVLAPPFLFREDVCMSTMGGRLLRHSLCRLALLLTCADSVDDAHSRHYEGQQWI